MLREIRIRNFKSYEDASLPLAPLTLMIGANASGKSNAIEAMEFLHWIAQGRRFDNIVQDVQEDNVSIRGRTVDLCRRGQSQFGLGCVIDPLDPNDRRLAWTQFEIGIRVRERGALELVHEQITSSDQKHPLYRIERPAEGYSNDVTLSFNNFAQGGNKPQITAMNQRALITQLDTPARFTTSASQRVIPAVVEHFRSALNSILFLDPSPRRMRGYSFVDEEQLRGDGSNLSSVLYSIKKRGGRDSVLDFLRSLPEKEIVDFDFVETLRNDVMIRVTETFGSQKAGVEAPLLSDGTLRVLSIAAALLSAPEGALVVIEEIDNGVHPSRARHLLTNIRKLAEKRKLRVLLSSHNPAFSDALPDESIRDVVVCFRDPEKGVSRLAKLGDHPRFVQVAVRGPIGQLMTRGVLHDFIVDWQSSDEKAERAKGWLDQFLEENSEEPREAV